MFKKIREQFNIFGHCTELDVELWSCPRFVFLIMGVVIICSILAMYYVAQRYAEPEMVILIVTLLTVFLLVIAQVLVSAFERVVYSRRKETAQTRELLELKDQFVYIAIHHLSSAATAIKWGLRTIAPTLTSLEPIEKEVFESIRDRNERLIELARQILLITQIESGHFALHNELVQPTDLIAESIADLTRSAKEKGITLSYNAPHNLPLYVLNTDKEQLGEILRLLLTNAINHANPEGGAVLVTISEKVGKVRITVENNGEAMDATVREHVFEKLWRDEHKKRIEGTGFGLYIVKYLTDALGGTIHFTSLPEKTTFILTLPKE